MAPDAPLPPGSVIGILGGGQLGRMLAMAAAEMGFRVHVFAPPGDNPATDVAHASTLAAWDDFAALDAFAAAVDAITYEFENIPVATAEFLASRKPLRPGVRALAVAQDRLNEKTLAQDLGIAVPLFRPVDAAAELAEARTFVGHTGRPAILKTRRLGYDGKGQAVIRSDADAAAAWPAIGGVPAILEEMIPFTREISVLVARGADGTVRVFDVPENRHRHGILDTSTVPAAVTPGLARRAEAIGRRIAEELGYVGLLAVELFVEGEGDDAKLLFNEIAPRVHNSGHWTTDACLVSQFEQHIRAVAGWPLGDPRRHSDVVMTNLIGADIDAWPALAAEPGARLHLYGKAESRPGRKMGHVNRIRPRSG
ncbi:MAG: 5-(carboxyamino)imidazole ribonucleotide synthase [Bauldia sp.]|nr:5-(carboxyamino)imidazole ribonucleotide synthase [Bauldia sp.]